MRIRWVIAFVALLCAAGPASAQETRAAALLKARQQKATALKPPHRGKLEKLADAMENRNLYDRLILGTTGGSTGFFSPYFGSLEPGSGLAIGPQYRNRTLFGREGTLKVFAAATLRKYWKAEARLTFAQLAGGRAFAEAYANRTDFPRKDYFGLGAQSLRSNRSDFAMRNTTFGGTAGARFGSAFRVGAGIELLMPSIGRGTSSLVRPTQDLFTDADTPGLTEQPDFAHYQVFAEFRNRTPERNPRAGGSYSASYHLYNDRDLDKYSFRRFDLDVQQYLPFLNEKRVIVLHGAASLSGTDPRRQVPFYLQPTLGGSHTLRGFRNYRFRGPNVLLLQAEYRWEIFPALDGALFYDTGKVELHRGDLNLSDLEHDYGIGFRFGTRLGVFLRIDLAFGSSDGKHFIVGFKHVF